VRERTRQLEAARAELQEFIDGMSTMAAKLTPEGRFLAANKGSLAASGLTLEQLLQTDIASGAWFAYDAQVQARARRALERARGGAPVSYADKVRVGEHLVDITFSLVPVRGASGQVDYIIAEGRDISSLKAAEAELLRSSQRLEEANRELEAFSYSVSHDLRAPVRHIEGFAHLLEQELKAPSTKASHYLRTISGAAKRMGALIEDLLMLSRTSRQPLSLRRVELAPVVEEVLAEVRRDAGDRRIRFEIGPLPAVMADAALIRIVLLNLLSNAVKYTRPRAEALVEVGSRVAQDGTLEVYVRDNGVGFDMRYAGKLFGVFQRLHRDEDFEGTGIGLATARRILARHEGWIRAEGEPDKGATITFSLRQAEAEA
jgi:PAS domain S-box-containing protein